MEKSKNKFADEVKKQTLKIIYLEICHLQLQKIKGI